MNRQVSHRGGDGGGSAGSGVLSHHVIPGWRLRALRRSRGKSLEVTAGLAGISKGYLSMLENDSRPLDRLSLIVALANALSVPPTQLMNLGEHDRTVPCRRCGRAVPADTTRQPGLPTARQTERFGG